MNTKETVNDAQKYHDKKADDGTDAVDMFKKLPEDVQSAILKLIRTMLHNK